MWRRFSLETYALFFGHLLLISVLFFFFSSSRRHTRFYRDWSSDVCSSDLCSKRRTRRKACARSSTRTRPSSPAASPAFDVVTGRPSPTMDAKTANLRYHDAAAAEYDAKWSISFDERCIDYVRERAERMLPGRRYGR